MRSNDTRNVKIIAITDDVIVDDNNLIYMFVFPSIISITRYMKECKPKYIKVFLPTNIIYLLGMITLHHAIITIIPSKEVMYWKVILRVTIVVVFNV